MHILFFSHYFPPEGNAPATRTYENCKEWVRRGHDVTVVTCVPNSPNGVVYDGYTNRGLQRDRIDGIEVLRVWTYVAANKGTVRRIANYVSYLGSAALQALRVARPDVIIATSPQFFCGWAGVVTRLWRRVPFVLEIRDIWPDSITAVGAMQDSLMLKPIYAMERWMYDAASHIVTVGEGYRRELQKKGVPAQKISVITNGVDPDQYLPKAPNLALKQKLGLRRPFVCSYVGTIGMACGLGVALETGALLKERGRDDIELALIGDGAVREELQKQAQERKLDNVTFTGRLPKQQMPEVLSFSDVSLVHLRKTDLFKTVLPSKIFEAASMERPIVLGVQGDSADILRKADAGLCIEPENAQQLTDALIHLADHPEERRRLGSNGRKHIQQHFNRKQLALDYLDLLQHIP